MKKITVILLCMAMLLSGCAWSVKAEAVSSSEDVWKTIEEAYIYAFPLVLMDATRTSATNTEKAAPGKAPVNQFMHGVALANAQFKNVVTPNVDTIYTQVWYELSEEPMIYVHPETDRFCKVQVLDAWTNTVAVLDRAGAYAITRSTWKGDLPDNVTRIDVPTAMAWAITRTVLSGEADLPNVYAVQAQMQLLPLSVYLSGEAYQPPKGIYREENSYVPINKVLSLDLVTFFNKANTLMEDNPPSAADAEILENSRQFTLAPAWNLTHLF